MDRISISEFKAKCLSILEKIRKTGCPLVVTKKGEPIVVVYPSPSEEKRAGFGAMRGTVEFKGDPFEPLPEEVWEGLK